MLLSALPVPGKDKVPELKKLWLRALGARLMGVLGLGVGADEGQTDTGGSTACSSV